MKTAIIYHRVDWDGYTSAAVALRAFPDAELIGWTYGDPTPCVDSFDKVILVDLSLSEDWMLQNASKLIWCEHHKNTIDRLMANPVLAAVPGIRRDGIGACALAWEYFFPKEELVHHVRFVATADVMDRTMCVDTPLEVALSYGLYLDTFGPGWSKETGDVSKHLVREAQRLFDYKECASGFSNGCTLEKTRQAHETELFKNKRITHIDNYEAVILQIDGRPNACILSHLLNNYADVFICVGDYLEDKEKYKVSLRVPEKSSFDASAFCRQYGGNGHIKAAGCLMSKEEIDALL